MPDTLRFPRDLLRLLHWLYFKPFTLRAYARCIAPELDKNLKLWELSDEQRSDPRVRHLLWLSLTLICGTPLVTVPLIGAVINWLVESGITDIAFSWIPTIAVMLGGIIGSLIDFLLLWKLRSRSAEWIIYIFAVAAAANPFLPDSIKNRFGEILQNAITQLQLSESPDTYYLAVGVALGVVFGMAVFVEAGVAGRVAGSVAGSVVFGVVSSMVLDVAVVVAVGVAVVVAGSVAFGVALGVAHGVEDGVARGVAVGVNFGVSVGVIVGLAVSETIGIAIGVAWTVAFLLFYFRLPFYLIELPWNLIVGRWAESAPPEKAARHFHLMPIYWDEVIWLPLWGLDHTLVEIGKKDRRLVQTLIADVAQSFRQGWAARNALIKLTAYDLERVADVQSIASIAEQLTWLPPDIPAELETVLPPIQKIAQYVQAALKSDTLYNKQRQLRDAYERTRRVREKLALHKDRRIAVQFGRILEQWESILSRKLVELKERS